MLISPSKQIDKNDDIRFKAINSKYYEENIIFYYCPHITDDKKPLAYSVVILALIAKIISG